MILSSRRAASAPDASTLLHATMGQALRARETKRSPPIFLPIWYCSHITKKLRWKSKCIFLIPILLTRHMKLILTSWSWFFFCRDSCSFSGSHLKTSFPITCTLCCSKKTCDELQKEKPSNTCIHNFSFSLQFYRMLLWILLEQLFSAVSALCKLMRQWQNTQKLQWN